MKKHEKNVSKTSIKKRKSEVGNKYDDIVLWEISRRMVHQREPTHFEVWAQVSHDEQNGRQRGHADVSA